MQQQATLQQRNASCYVLRWLLVVLWAGFIFFMSARTSGELGTGFLAMLTQFANETIERLLGRPFDVALIAHFCEYLVLGILLARALNLSTSAGLAFCMAVVLASMYGVTDEFHQQFVQGRTPDMLDWIADTAGAAVGGIVRLVAHTIARR